MTPNILQTPPNQQSHLQPQHQHQNINIMQNQHMIHYSHNQPYPIRSNIIN